MQLGYSGVNLHGGSGHAQAVSVGGTFVGEADMKDRQPAPPQALLHPHRQPRHPPRQRSQRQTQPRLSPGTHRLRHQVRQPPSPAQPCSPSTSTPAPSTPSPTPPALQTTPSSSPSSTKTRPSPSPSNFPTCTLHQVLTAPSLTLPRKPTSFEGPAATARVPIRNATALIPAATGATFLLT